MLTPPSGKALEMNPINVGNRRIFKVDKRRQTKFVK
jgi:hypothetical protein